MSWRALAEGMLGTSIGSARPMSGGCVSEVHRLELDDGRGCVAKCGPRDRLDGEAHGLDALSGTGVVRVPRVLGIAGADGAGVLLLEALEPGADPDWAAFGRDLAAGVESLTMVYDAGHDLGSARLHRNARFIRPG